MCVCVFVCVIQCVCVCVCACVCERELRPVAGTGEAEPAGEAWRRGELDRSGSQGGLERNGLFKRPETDRQTDRHGVTNADKQTDRDHE